MHMKRFVFRCGVRTLPRPGPRKLLQGVPIAMAISMTLALPCTVWAQAAAASEPAAAASGGLGWFGGELLLLALLAACTWTVFYVLRRKRQVALGGGDERVRVLSITPLGARERLAVLRVRDRTLLVGVTAAQITLLAELDAVAAAPAGENVRADSAVATSATPP